MRMRDTESNHQNSTGSAFVWWRAGLLRYNKGLLVSGLTAFVLYCALVAFFSKSIPELEITVFTMALQAFGYLLFMGAANICYLMGPCFETFVPRNKTSDYRMFAYELGYWFSVALPFFVPALFAYYALCHPGLLRV